MKRRFLRLTALLTVLCLLLIGCTVPLPDWLPTTQTPSSNTPAIESFEYTRPDPERLQQLLEQCLELAQGQDIDAVEAAIWKLYNAYDSFITNYSLADLHYYADVTDTYWAAESTYCTENIHLADAVLEELYYGLAKSPMRQQLEGDDYFGAGFFDDYEGESTAMDPQLLALLEQEAALLNEYYELCADSAHLDPASGSYREEWIPRFADLYARLIAVRQQLSTFLGFETYADYAYALTYGRDYSPQQAMTFLEECREALYEDYRKANLLIPYPSGSCSEEEAFQYVKNTAQAMGGDIWDSFRMLEENRLYDLTYSENKYDISYEIFLWSYGVPYIFTCPYNDPVDQLTFAHEFGHFTNDYVCGGSNAGIDVAEVHSQAFEYLSLLYGEPSQALAQYKLSDSMYTYMETGAYAYFEHQAYALTGDQLTGENLLQLAQQTAWDFAFDCWGGDGLDFVTIGHFYTHPLYMISYVVSNDVALQFYQLELNETGAGLALYEECIYSQDSQITAFALLYGLESPFTEGRATTVAQTFREALWN